MPCFQGSDRNRNPSAYFRKTGLAFFVVGLAILLCGVAVSIAAIWFVPAHAIMVILFVIGTVAGAVPLMIAGAKMLLT